MVLSIQDQIIMNGLSIWSWRFHVMRIQIIVYKVFVRPSHLMMKSTFPSREMCTHCQSPHLTATIPGRMDRG